MIRKNKIENMFLKTIFRKYYFVFLDWIEACFQTHVLVNSIVLQNDPVTWNIRNITSYFLQYKSGDFYGNYTNSSKTVVSIKLLYQFCIVSGQNTSNRLIRRI